MVVHDSMFLDTGIEYRDYPHCCDAFYNGLLGDYCIYSSADQVLFLNLCPIALVLSYF